MIGCAETKIYNNYTTDETTFDSNDDICKYTGTSDTTSCHTIDDNVVYITTNYDSGCEIVWNYEEKREEKSEWILITLTEIIEFRIVLFYILLSVFILLILKHILEIRAPTKEHNK